MSHQLDRLTAALAGRHAVVRDHAMSPMATVTAPLQLNATTENHLWPPSLNN